MMRAACLALGFASLGLPGGQAAELARPEYQAQATAPLESLPRHVLLLDLGRSWLATQWRANGMGGPRLDVGPRLSFARISAAFRVARPDPSVESEFFVAPLTADWFGHLVPGLQFEFDF